MWAPEIVGDSWMKGIDERMAGAHTRDMNTNRIAKVRIPLTVDIDVDAWVEEYGAGSMAEIREDVRRHIENMVRAQLDSLGVSA